MRPFWECQRRSLDRTYRHASEPPCRATFPSPLSVQQPQGEGRRADSEGDPQEWGTRFVYEKVIEKVR